MTDYDDFPIYTDEEVAADRVVHMVGLGGAALCIAWLVAHQPIGASLVHVISVWVYSVGLSGMLCASAAYNLTPASGLKAALRHLDRSMIFVMIAGTYTPFALNSMPRSIGVPLCLAVWSLGGLGVALEWTGRPWAHRLALPLYLMMGWLVVGVLPALHTAVGHLPFVLLIAGGMIYSLGAALQAHGRLLFHNAVWHAMVIAAAGLHYAAVVLTAAA